MHTVDVRDVPPARVVGFKHIGAYTDIGVSFEKLAAVLFSRDLFAKAGAMVGIYYDDPSATSEESLNSVAGVVLPEDVLVPEDCVVDIVEGGKHAVLTFQGHYSGLPEAYQWLYGTWLPASGHEPADAAVSEVYLNSPRDVPPQELLTEIHLPLKA
jgi:AraC family transcriptional regulator